MIPETINSFFGWTLNPHNLEWSAGGSSGGEAALVAANCSPVGIGTDIGGSVWIPASFCGIYGFKSGWKRGSYKGILVPSRVHSAGAGGVEIKSVAGPFGWKVEDLVAIQEVLFSKELYERDMYMAPSYFNKSTYQLWATKKKLRLGFFEYDEMF